MINRRAMDKNKNIAAVSGIISPADNGKRLDAALASFYPGLGVRARRRLWEWCQILLDGREVGAGAEVRTGQQLEIIPVSLPDTAAKVLCGDLRLVAQSAAFCAIYKPAGLPSAMIKGSGTYSAEEYVSANWRRFGSGQPPLLCNRLDTGTSGLLLWAFGQENLAHFRAIEAEGLVEKRYFALVQGEAPENMHIDRALNVSNREKTQVLEQPDQDTTRHTVLNRVALRKLDAETVSILDVTIRRGGRHQIRAHLAWAGFPIVGDALYGESGGLMYLHHYRITFSGFSAEFEAPWAFMKPGYVAR